MIRDTPPPALEYRIIPPSSMDRISAAVPGSTTPPPSPPRTLHLDDVFGDVSPPRSLIVSHEHAADVPGDGELDLGGLMEGPEASEVPALRRIHTTAGYRDGVAASKERFVQEGFDEGYALGGEIGIRVGWILGGLEGCVAALMKKNKNAVGKKQEEAMQELGEARKVLEKARDELKLEKVLGREWVAEDGIWGWKVGGEDDDKEEDITFKEVAAAHPVIAKWMEVLEERSKTWGLQLGYPVHEDSDEEKEENTQNNG